MSEATVAVVKAWYQNDWGRFGRRDERIARALVRDPRVRRVVHLEPPVARDLLSSDRIEELDPLGITRRRTQGWDEGLLSLYTPTFTRGESDALRRVVTEVAEFLERREIFDGDALLWVSAPGVLGDALLELLGERFRWIVTEVEDDHRQYHAPGSAERLAIERRYERALRRSDLFVSNSRAMVREFSRWQPHALHVPNGVDLEEYQGRLEEPSWLSAVPRPRLAYVGNLRLRLRTDLLQALAEAFPQASLVLAGEGGEELRSLDVRDNVHLPGCIPSEEVPGFLRSSDVLLLPHVEGALTESMDPQKLYEYLASARPIVATPVAGARDHGDVIRLARDAQEMVSGVAAALTERDPALELRRRSRVAGRTWDGAARAVLEAVLDVPEPGRRLSTERGLAYYEHPRPELRELVPEDAVDVLDVGCGAGALGQSVRRDGVARRVTGIERDPAAAARAAERLDRVLVGDALEEMRRLLGASHDAILFADILEHLAEPADVLAEARRVLRPGGVVVASLPNVRHWSVIRQLLEGDFHYEDAGILDRTHLRFFTRRSGRRLLEEAGFVVEAERGTRWSEQGAPADFIEALRGCGVAVNGLAEESGDHQNVFVARAPWVASVPVKPRSTGEVSVVIPVCNAAGYTRSCLEELRQRGGSKLAEVIVVDNGSSDETSEVLGEFPEVRVLRNERNRGFAAAVNQGVAAAAAAAPLVCVLNNDTLLTDGWLEALCRVLEEEPRVAMVGPSTNYANGRQQVDLGDLDDVAAMRAWSADQVRRERGVVEDVWFLSGFCFLMRREVLRGVGGLREEYETGTYEDTELCRTLRRRGGRLLIARDSFVYHFGNRTFRALGVDMEEQQRVNGRRFVDRHHDDAGMLARAAREQGEWREALAQCHRGMVRDPHDLDALRIAGEALLRLGHQGEGARVLDRYLEACPADVEAGELVRVESALEPEAV